LKRQHCTTLACPGGFRHEETLMRRTLVPVVDVIYGWGCANIDFYRRSM